MLLVIESEKSGFYAQSSEGAFSAQRGMDLVWEGQWSGGRVRRRPTTAWTHDSVLIQVPLRIIQRGSASVKKKEGI